jgi:hypothetical protein
MVALISAKSEGEELLKIKEPAKFGPALATTLSYPITIPDSWDVIFAMSKLEKEPLETLIDDVVLTSFPPESARRRMVIIGMGQPEIGASLSWPGWRSTMPCKRKWSDCLLIQRARFKSLDSSS